ncbi:MAG: hypothetical protein WBO10_18115 [Pyrinomonadaceae bacterium]
MKIALVFAAILLSIPNLACYRLAGQKSEAPGRDADRSQIFEVVNSYNTLAKEEKFQELRGLVTRTPPYYWQNQDGLKPQDQPASNNSTGSEGYEDFDDHMYSHVTETVPLALTNLKSATIDEQSLQILDKYARVQVATKYQNPRMPVFNDDYFLFRDGKDWKIFRISLTNSENRFPF